MKPVKRIAVLVAIAPLVGLLWLVLRLWGSSLAEDRRAELAGLVAEYQQKWGQK